MWVLFTNDKFKKLNSLKLLLNFEVIFLLLTVTTVTIYTNQITILMPKNIIATTVLLNVVYIFLNLWFYFINIYTHSTYTTSVQRFWKRTFTLFWIIEGFLFSIFLYLWLIAPQETGIFIDKYSQNSSFFYKNNESLTYLTLNLLLVLVNFNLILSKKTNEHYFFFD